MKCIKFICVLLCVFNTVLLNAQQPLDTICIVGNPSHIAIPDTEGSHYTWDVEGGSILSQADSSDIKVLWGPSPGFFNVSVTEVNKYGCISDPVQAVVYLSLPEKALIEGPEEVCQGTEVTLNGLAGPDFIWMGGEKRKSLSFIAKRDTLIYLVALNGPCKNDTFYHQIKVLQTPLAAINPLSDTVDINTELDLFYTGTSAQNVDWYINDHYHGSGYYQNYELTDSGNYEITQVVNSGICTDTVKTSVYVTDDFAVYIPNAFTPNGDNINDIFRFKGRGIRNFEARIYNRWGGLLFIWNELEGGWNGTFEGEPAKQDTYVYRINIFDKRGGMHTYTGSVNLIR